MRRAALAALLSSFLASAAAAQIVPPQNSKPLATAKIDTIPAPKDIAYPGTMQLTVDASDVTRAIFKIHQHVPVPGPGDFVMLYPKWLPGHHSPSGQINKVGKLGFTVWSWKNGRLHGVHASDERAALKLALDIS